MRRNTQRPRATHSRTTPSDNGSRLHRESARSITLCPDVGAGSGKQLPVRPVSRLDWRRVSTEKAKKLQDLRENMGAGIKLSPEDPRAVREPVDEANVAQEIVALRIA
jgi:hypothetical protein